MDYFSSSTLAQSSKKLYNNRISNWLSILPESCRKLEFIIYFPTKALEMLSAAMDEKDNTTTNRHMYISAVCAIFKHSDHLIKDLPDKDICRQNWIGLLKKNDEPIMQRMESQMPTENQLQKSGTYLAMDEIVAIRDKLPHGTIERLLISFYTLIPPVRADYYATQLVYNIEDVVSPNYILLTKGNAELVITDFKTASTFGRIHHPSLPKSLYRELIASLELFPRNYLFVSSECNLFARETFSTWASRLLTKVFKRTFTLTLFRHIYISSLDLNTESGILKDISSKMGHSITMQMMYKWKGLDIGDIQEDKKSVIQKCCEVYTEWNNNGESSEKFMEMFRELFPLLKRVVERE
jgi:hypothetical protein